MKSLSERALCEIEKRLKSLREEEGYTSSAGLNVFRARRTVNEKELPALVLWDGGEAPADNKGTSGGRMSMVLNFSVESLACANQEETGREIERMKADVKRVVCGKEKSGALGADENGKAFATISYKGATPFAREDGSNSESMTLQFSATYPEMFGDPFTQQ